MADWSYPGLKKGDENPCDGCHECGLRCTSGIQMTRQEFALIVEHLRSLEAKDVRRVLEQEKRIVWFEDIETEACLFYNTARQGCLVYPARPLICRLFGRVEWLPCPREKPLSKIKGGLELIQLYAKERRVTFAEWCTKFGIFDLRELTAEHRGPDRI